MGTLWNWRVPETADLWTTWSVVAASKSGEIQSFRNFTIVPPTCQFGCGVRSTYPRSCSCDPLCGPPGGSYEVCCEDRDMYCIAQNQTSYINIITPQVVANDARVEIEWWFSNDRKEEGNLLRVRDQEKVVMELQNPGFGRRSFHFETLSLGNHTVELVDSDNKMLAKNTFLCRTDGKQLSGSVTMKNGKQNATSEFYGADADIKEEGYHILTLTKNTCVVLNGKDSDPLCLAKKMEILYHAETQIDDFNLDLVSKDGATEYTFAGELVITGDYYGNAFQYQWTWAGNVTSRGDSVGSFYLESSPWE